MWSNLSRICTWTAQVSRSVVEEYPSIPGWVQLQAALIPLNPRCPVETAGRKGAAARKAQVQVGAVRLAPRTVRSKMGMQSSMVALMTVRYSHQPFFVFLDHWLEIPVNWTNSEVYKWVGLSLAEKLPTRHWLKTVDRNHELLFGLSKTLKLRTEEGI